MGTLLPMSNALCTYRLIRIFQMKILFPFLSITTFTILFDNNDFFNPVLGIYRWFKSFFRNSLFIRSMLCISAFARIRENYLKKLNNHHFFNPLQSFKITILYIHIYFR